MFRWSEADKRINAKRVTAIVVLSVLLLVSVLSVAFLVKEANHSCIGKNCPTCATIMQCVVNMNHVKACDTDSVISYIACFFMVITVCLCTSVMAFSSPVSRKERLNN